MKKYFGGSHLRKKRKTQRPLDFGKLTHLVLKLKDNQPTFFSPKGAYYRPIKYLFYQLAAKYGIQIEELIFNHTHIHTVIAIKDRKSYQGFIRELTSKIVAGLSKRIGIKLRDIFCYRPFTRIVSWQRGLMVLRQYMKKNEKESGISQNHEGLYVGRYEGQGLCRAHRIKNGAEYWRESAQLKLL